MDTEAFDREFHFLLGRLVHAHARFDFNVGLQLHWMGPMYGVDVSELLHPYKATFKARLDLFKRLVLDVYQPAGVAFVTEFRAWFDRAEKCRVLRNDYAQSWETQDPSSSFILARPTNDVVRVRCSLRKRYYSSAYFRSFVPPSRSATWTDP